MGLAAQDAAPHRRLGLGQHPLGARHLALEVAQQLDLLWVRARMPMSARGASSRPSRPSRW